MTDEEHILLDVREADIRDTPADVLIVKYADGFHGADLAVASRLKGAGIEPAELGRATGQFAYVETRSALPARHVLYCGVGPLYEFDYGQIERFGEGCLSFLGTRAPQTRHVATTIHGPGYGLDEGEALLSLLSGMMAAIRESTQPANLATISVVDHDPSRVERLRSLLEVHFASVSYARPNLVVWGYDLSVTELRGARGDGDSLPSHHFARHQKRHVFVAMPFAKEFDDVFYYGIQRPVHDLGYLCERLDHESFTGEILTQIKQRIETAAAVVADLTGANPNVYLEVGYAWGKAVPTIFLVRSESDLLFDVKAQKCLMYTQIRELETSLGNELAGLKAKNLI